MKSITFGGLLCLMVFALSCSSSKKVSKTVSTLSQNNWQLYSLETTIVTPPDEGSIPFISFDEKDMKVSGTSSCNTFSANFKVNKQHLTFSNIISTKKACVNMTMENKFLKAMANTANYTFYQEKLVLKDSSGSQLMSFDRYKK